MHFANCLSEGFDGLEVGGSAGGECSCEEAYEGAGEGGHGGEGWVEDGCPLAGGGDGDDGGDAEGCADGSADESGDG